MLNGIGFAEEKPKSRCIGTGKITHVISVDSQVLVLGNKRDITGALDEKELIERM